VEVKGLARGSCTSLAWLGSYAWELWLVSLWWGAGDRECGRGLFTIFHLDPVSWEISGKLLFGVTFISSLWWSPNPLNLWSCSSLYLTIHFDFLCLFLWFLFNVALGQSLQKWWTEYSRNFQLQTSSIEVGDWLSPMVQRLPVSMGPLLSWWRGSCPATPFPLLDTEWPTDTFIKSMPAMNVVVNNTKD
jgi:hypothetical protein